MIQKRSYQIKCVHLVMLVVMLISALMSPIQAVQAIAEQNSDELLQLRNSKKALMKSTDAIYYSSVQAQVEPPKTQVRIPIRNGLSVSLVKTTSKSMAAEQPDSGYRGLYSVFGNAQVVDLPKVELRQDTSFSELTEATKNGPVELDTINANKQVQQSEVVIPANLKNTVVLEFSNPMNKSFNVIATSDASQQTLFKFKKRTPQDLVVNKKAKVATSASAKKTTDKKHQRTEKELTLTRPIKDVVQGLTKTTKAQQKPLAFATGKVHLAMLTTTDAALAQTGLTLPEADTNDPKNPIPSTGISDDLLWPKEEVTSVPAQNGYADYQKITKWYSSKNDGVADYYVVFRVYTGTTGKYAAADGQAVLNGDDAVGHDSSYTNHLVRVNDQMIYHVTATMNKIGDKEAHQVPNSLSNVNLYIRGNGTTTVPNAYSSDTDKQLRFSLSQTGREATGTFSGKVNDALDEGDQFTTEFSPMSDFSELSVTTDKITAKATTAFQIRTVNQITGSGLATKTNGSIYDSYKAYGDLIGDRDYNAYTNLLGYGYVIMPKLTSDNPNGVGISTKVGSKIHITMNLQQQAYFSTTTNALNQIRGVDYTLEDNVRNDFYGVANFSTAAGQDQLKTSSALSASAPSGTKIWNLKNQETADPNSTYLPVHWNDSQILNARYTNDSVHQFGVTGTLDFDFVIPSDFRENYATFGLFFKDRNNFDPGNGAINTYTGYQVDPKLYSSTTRQLNLDSYAIDDVAQPIYTDYQVSQWQQYFAGSQAVNPNERVYPAMADSASTVKLYVPDPATVAQAKSWGVEDQLSRIYGQYQVVSLPAGTGSGDIIENGSKLFPDNPLAVSLTDTGLQAAVTLPNNPVLINPANGSSYTVKAQWYEVEVGFSNNTINGKSYVRTLSSHDISDVYTGSPTGLVVAGFEADPLLKQPYDASKDQLSDWTNQVYNQWTALDKDKNATAALGSNRTDDVTTNATYRLNIQVRTPDNSHVFELKNKLDMMSTWNSDAFSMSMTKLNQLVSNPKKYQDPFAISFEATSDISSPNRFFDWSKIIKLGYRTNDSNDPNTWHFDTASPANNTNDYQWVDWATAWAEYQKDPTSFKKKYNAIRYDFRQQDVYIVDYRVGNWSYVQPGATMRVPLVYDSTEIGNQTNGNPDLIRSSIQVPGTGYNAMPELLSNPEVPTTLRGYTYSNGLATSTSMSPSMWTTEWLNANRIGYRYAGKSTSNEFLTSNSLSEQAGKANLIFSRRYYGYNGEPLTPGSGDANRFISELKTSYVLLTSASAAQPNQDIRLIIPQNSKGYYNQSVDGVGQDASIFAKTFKLKTTAYTPPTGMTYQQTFAPLYAGSTGSAYTDETDKARNAAVLAIDWTDPDNQKALQDYYQALQKISGQNYIQGLPLTYADIGFDLSDILAGKNNNEAAFMTKDVFAGTNSQGQSVPEEIAPAFDTLQSPSDATEQNLKNRAYVNVQLDTSYGIKETIQDYSVSGPGNKFFWADTAPTKKFSIYITIDAKNQSLINPYGNGIVPFNKDDVASKYTGKAQLLGISTDSTTSAGVDKTKLSYYVNQDKVPKQSLLPDSTVLGNGRLKQYGDGSGIGGNRYHYDSTVYEDGKWVNVASSYQDKIAGGLLNAFTVDGPTHNVDTKAATQFGYQYAGTLAQGQQIVIRLDFQAPDSFVKASDYIKHESYLGYQGADTKVYPVSNIVRYQQTEQLGMIKFHKIDADNHNSNLAGAQFILVKSQQSASQIYSMINSGKSTADILAGIAADNALKNDVLSDGGSPIVQTSDANGLGVFDGIQMENPDYWLVEIGAPSGYQLSDQKEEDVIHSVTAALPGTNGTVGAITVQNKRDNAPKFKIYKTDENGKPLAGATFKLWADAAHTQPVTENGKDEFITDANGQLDLSSLVLGNTYWIQEVKAPDGYELSKKEVVVQFTEDHLGDVVSIDGQYVRNVNNDNNGNALIHGEGPYDPDKNYLTFTMTNAPKSLLPFTGSFIIWGLIILLIIGAGFLYWLLRRKHGKGMIALAVLLAAGSLGLQHSHSASASSTYGITIQKYVDQNGNEATIKHDGTQDSSVTVGTDLVSVSGVQYNVTPITPTGSAVPDVDRPTSYMLHNDQRQTLTTDSDGKAEISLVAGYYLVTELPSVQVKQPMKLVIVQLPMTLRDGTTINQVWVYPKSGVVTPNKPGLPNTHIPPTTPSLPPTTPSVPPVTPGLPNTHVPPTMPDRLTQTSSGLGNQQNILVLTIGLLMMLTTGYVLKQKMRSSEN